MSNVKITVYEARRVPGHPRAFIVLKTVNTIDPAVGADMTADDITAAIDSGSMVTVTAKPSR